MPEIDIVLHLNPVLLLFIAGRLAQWWRAAGAALGGSQGSPKGGAGHCGLAPTMHQCWSMRMSGRRSKTSSRESSQRSGFGVKQPAVPETLPADAPQQPARAQLSSTARQHDLSSVPSDSSQPKTSPAVGGGRVARHRLRRRRGGFVGHRSGSGDDDRVRARVDR